MTEEIDWGVPDEFTLPANEQWRGIPLQFDPPGPVGEAYMYGKGEIDFIMGPVGSGKTTSSIFRILATAMRCPVCRDGVIRARGAVLHVNGRALARTFLASLFRYLPRDLPSFKFEGGQDRPFTYTMRFQTPKGKRLQIILDGFGIGDHAIEELLRGYEANFAVLVEVDLMSREVPPSMFARVAQGRYPGKAMLADPNATIPGTVFGDLNPPNIAHWINEDFVEKPQSGYRLFRQPSGLSEQAENRKFTTKADYEKLGRVLKKDKKRRFVGGEFGLVADGDLVYEDFDHMVHVASMPLQPLDNIPLRIGFDAKGTPAAAIGQFTPKGQLRVLDELNGEPNMSAGRFAEGLIALLQAKYRGLPIDQGWADPSGFYGADRKAGEISFMEIIGKALSLYIMPTPTNDPTMRQEAVSFLLGRAQGNEPVPFFLLNPTCKMLLAGFQGGFVIKLNPHDTTDRTAFVKNKYSHLQEALQYLAYGCRGHAGIINDAARAGRPGNVVPISSGKRPKNAMDMDVP